MYSEKARQLITELPNRGTLANATHTSSVENPVCGDITHFYLRVENGVICDCRFQTFGCPGALAASAAVTVLCKGRTLNEVQQLTRKAILEYLGGLPSHKLHGVDLAIEALRQAIGKS
ncbi:iron-sulfur cluster assembly scaffold protein [Acidobacteria bacterium AH-259-O06]|nr:iron-sulfur cluster assembly scaffold protein [Acidobacteria bacterium AH-259-O06]